jgi:hypothetical protein
VTDCCEGDYLPLARRKRVDPADRDVVAAGHQIALAVGLEFINQRLFDARSGSSRRRRPRARSSRLPQVFVRYLRGGGSLGVLNAARGDDGLGAARQIVARLLQVGGLASQPGCGTTAPLPDTGRWSSRARSP